MSNKEERMNRNKSIIEDYKNGKPILEIARESFRNDVLQDSKRYAGAASLF